MLFPALRKEIFCRASRSLGLFKNICILLFSVFSYGVLTEFHLLGLSFTGLKIKRYLLFSALTMYDFFFLFFFLFSHSGKSYQKKKVYASMFYILKSLFVQCWTCYIKDLIKIIMQNFEIFYKFFALYLRWYCKIFHKIAK